MAQKTLSVCDVFGTTKDVHAVEVLVKFGDSVQQYNVDMGTRARARLYKLITKGTTPPNRKPA